MGYMAKFFKGTEKLPFKHPPIIESRKRSRNYLIWIIGILVVLIAGYLLLNLSTNLKNQQIPSKQSSGVFPQMPFSQDSKNVDYNASFAIFTNGTFRVFTANMYHNLSENVFIQSDNPNIVHVKKSGVTWDTFFKTLPFKLTNNCLTTGTKETFCTNEKETLKFYLNGVKTDDLLSREIKENDQVLISYGSENDEQIQSQLRRLNKF